jgi:hypothetical protein
MTNQLQIEIGDTVRIAETSSYYHALRETNPKCNGIVREIRGHLVVDWENNTSNIYQPYDLILIKKGKTMKEFTKSDLKTGMFVKYRKGSYRMVLGDIITGDGWMSLNELRDDLSEGNTSMGTLDVMSVYVTKSNRAIGEYFKGNGLTLIWERTEQTPAQKEMEVLQAKMDELQEQMKVVQAKL